MVPMSSRYTIEKMRKVQSVHMHSLGRGFKACVQIVRSSGFFLQPINESSLYKAYLWAIRSAKQFIYIENLYFLTFFEEHRFNPKNQIGIEIVKKIFEAHERGKTFKVFIVCSLLPGFSGSLGSNQGLLNECIIKITVNSMSRNPRSILARLEQYGIKNWENYISFCSLRQYGRINGTPVTECV